MKEHRHNKELKPAYQSQEARILKNMDACEGNQTYQITQVYIETQHIKEHN